MEIIVCEQPDLFPGRSDPDPGAADLTPIASRGAYYGILGLVWAFSSVAYVFHFFHRCAMLTGLFSAPPLAGALASANQWRWVFYLVCKVIRRFCLI